MLTSNQTRLTLFGLSLGVIALAGCDYDNHPTATGKTVTPPGTVSVEDPGKVNAGGPGSQGQLPK